MRQILKVHRQYYERIIAGSKTFEIRYNDRGYQRGDVVHLQEYDPDAVKLGEGYSGRQCKAFIGHVTNLWQKENIVVFSLLSVEEINGSESKKS